MIQVSLGGRQNSRSDTGRHCAAKSCRRRSCSGAEREGASRFDALNLLNEAMLLTAASHLFRPFLKIRSEIFGPWTEIPRIDDSIVHVGNVTLSVSDRLEEIEVCRPASGRGAPWLPFLEAAKVR